MRVVIIEDEIQAIAALKKEIADNLNTLEICGEAGTIEKARILIEEQKPDLIFLDIQLKDGNGFDLLRGLGDYVFEVIFTTAYSHYALDAIKISALDYLLKPIDTDELIKAVNKVKQHSLRETQLKLTNLAYNEFVNPLRKKIAIPTSNGIYLHELDNILRLQSDGNYTAIYLSDGKRLMVAKILREFEELLGNLGFVRIHNSHIINLNHLESYINKDGGYIIMNNKKTLPVSKRKKSTLLNVLNNIHK